MRPDEAIWRAYRPRVNRLRQTAEAAGILDQVLNTDPDHEIARKNRGPWRPVDLHHAEFWSTGGQEANAAGLPAVTILRDEQPPAGLKHTLSGAAMEV